MTELSERLCHEYLDASRSRLRAWRNDPTYHAEMDCFLDVLNYVDNCMEQRGDSVKQRIFNLKVLLAGPPSADHALLRITDRETAEANMARQSHFRMIVNAEDARRLFGIEPDPGGTP